MPPASDYEPFILIHVIAIALTGCSIGLLFYGLVAGKSALMYRVNKRLVLKGNMQSQLVLTLVRIGMIVAMICYISGAYSGLCYLYLGGSARFMYTTMAWGIVFALFNIIALFPVNYRQKEGPVENRTTALPAT